MTKIFSHFIIFTASAMLILSCATANAPHLKEVDAIWYIFGFCSMLSASCCKSTPKRAIVYVSI